MFSIRYLKAMFFSVVAYRVKDCVEIIESTFPNHTAHFKGDKGNAHFSGMVVDKVGKEAFFVERGTGGDNGIAEAIAWYHDLMIAKTGPDGVGDGAQHHANETFEWFKSHFYNYNTWTTCGHSMGNMAAQALIYLMCNERSKANNQRFLCYGFSGTPVFKGPAVSKINALLQERNCRGEKLLDIYRTTVPGDPLGSDIFRSKLGGVDVGENVFIPDIIHQRIGPAEAINHSPSILIASIARQMDYDRDFDPVKRYIIAEAARYCIN